jgi:hypothetical protein
VVGLGAVGLLVCAGLAAGEDRAATDGRTAEDVAVAGPPAAQEKAAQPRQEKPPEADAETLRKLIELQQKQIETLQKESRLLAEQATKQAAALAEVDQLRKQVELQQKQIGVLQRESRLLAEQATKPAPDAAVDALQQKTAGLEARSQQAAQRDRDLSQVIDSLVEQTDADRRNGPPLPANLKQWFVPSQANVTPLSVWSTMATLYNVFPSHKGAGTVQFQEFTPFFFAQLNNRFLLSAETTFTQSGVSLGQAQIDAFVNDWLTATVGYFLSPVGFWSERLDPRWINKLPDVPLVMRQVIPDGLTTTGLQLRGAKYLGRLPLKFEYSAFATNGLGVPGNGTAADFADLGGLIGTTSGINDAAAYGGRIALWLPRRGINFGVSEFVNAPYTRTSGPVVSIWQPYFNYHYGNWDARFEYGDNREQTTPFIGHNISRTGLYAQVAYRNYQSLHPHLQRLEFVFRFSDSYFHGINLSPAELASFSVPMNAPVDRNQYTVGINYYFYATAFLKLAYEFNDEIHRPLADNAFMAQFVTNF